MLKLLITVGLLVGEICYGTTIDVTLRRVRRGFGHQNTNGYGGTQHGTPNVGYGLSPHSEHPLGLGHPHRSPPIIPYPRRGGGGSHSSNHNQHPAGGNYSPPISPHVGGPHISAGYGTSNGNQYPRPIIHHSIPYSPPHGRKSSQYPHPGNSIGHGHHRTVAPSYGNSIGHGHHPTVPPSYGHGHAGHNSGPRVIHGLGTYVPKYGQSGGSHVGTGAHRPISGYHNPPSGHYNNNNNKASLTLINAAALQAIQQINGLDKDASYSFTGGNAHGGYGSFYK